MPETTNISEAYKKFEKNLTRGGPTAWRLDKK
jgi:hypothetical protein